jgi:hypothetical protein
MKMHSISFLEHVLGHVILDQLPNAQIRGSLPLVCRCVWLFNLFLLLLVLLSRAISSLNGTEATSSHPASVWECQD